MKRLKLYLIITIMVLLSGCSLTSVQVEQKLSLDETSAENLIKAHVERVVDGDTIICNIDEEEITVRLIGIDAPESVHPEEEKNTEEGELASEYTKEMLEGRDIYLEYDIVTEDKYGRTLAYVWINGELFNKRILKDGHAVLMTVLPNVKYVDLLVGE